VTRLTAIVPATDSPATLSRVLAAIERAAEPPEEVIVVDEPPGAGPAEARNAGARRATGDVLVFVDADVEVHQDALARIRSTFDSHDAPAAVFGSYDDDPEAPGLVSGFRNLLHHHVHQLGAGPATTFWAGLGAVRTEAFRALGGFDAGRFPRASIEDIELGLRLHKSGRRIVLDPELQGKHLKAWTFSGMTDTDLRRRAIPWLRLMLEEEAPSTALNLGWRHRVATAAAVGLAGSLARRRGRQAAGALALLLVLDGDFYSLLLRRRGWRLAAAGVPLHVAHRLTSAAAVPVAIAAHLAASRSSRLP
jgi:cellulose synthase/poly-beta-1,6-N-acetylglucosamine synthase-like glycosyltransferase